MTAFWRGVVRSIVLLLCCTVFLTACFDRRELDTMGIVLGVAIDKADADDRMSLTVQMVNPSGGKSSDSKNNKESKSDSDSSTGGGAYINVENTGTNINYIIREMQHKMSRRIYIAHSQVIVIGEEQAKHGVRDCLDFLARAPEARMTVKLFVAKGKGHDILEVQPAFEKVPSVELSKMLKNQRITSNAPIITEFDFITKMISQASSAVAPIVRVIDDNGKRRLSVSGSAVFDSSKMVGELDNRETLGMLIMNNNFKTGVLLEKVHDVPVTVEIRKSRSQVKAILKKDNTVEMNITASAIIGLGDQTGTFNVADPEHSKELIDVSRRTILAYMESAVEKAKELGCDTFGFGDAVNRKYPRHWKQISSQWRDIFKTVKVNIVVNVKSNGSGRTIKPLTSGVA